MFAKAIDGWQPRTRGELGDAFPLLAEHAVYTHDDCLHEIRGSNYICNSGTAEPRYARSAFSETKSNQASLARS
jgi:hypothetical protein